MDPNATLADIRAHIANADPASAIEAFRDLDEWLSSGGFLPTAWRSRS